MTTEKQNIQDAQLNTEDAKQSIETPAAIDCDDLPLIEHPEAQKAFELGMGDSENRLNDDFKCSSDFIDLCISILDRPTVDEGHFNNVLDAYYYGYITIVKLGVIAPPSGGGGSVRP